MKNKAILYYPLFIAILIFTVDKAALIPGWHESGRREFTALENMANGLQLSLSAKSVKADSEKRPRVIFLGSSRSEMFMNLSKNTISRDPFTDEAAKKSLKEYFFESRFIVRASEVFVSAFLVDKLLKSETMPEIIAIELSPEMFTSNNPNNMKKHIYDNIIEIDFIGKILPLVHNYDTRKELLLRFLFSTYAYKFRPQRLPFSGSPGSGNIAVTSLMMKPNMADLNNAKSVYDEGQIPEAVYKERFEGYGKTVFSQFQLENYVFDEDLLRILFHTADRLKERNIKVIFWKPFVHPVIKGYWDNNIHFDPYQAVIEKELKRRNIPFVDVSKMDLKCRQFTDSSHLAPTCSPLVADILLKSLKN